MTPVFALQPIPLDRRPSIFLAGPTPRREHPVPSWRPQALDLLRGIGFDGLVFVPEATDWSPNTEYDGQVQWEWDALEAATAIAFWIPRDLVTLPAFTTNVEFGLWARSGKAVLGCPPGSPKNRYLIALAHRPDCRVPVRDTLPDTLAVAAALATHPAVSP